MQNPEVFTLYIGNVSVAGCRPFPALVRDGRALALDVLKPWAARAGLHLAGSHCMEQLLAHWQLNQPALLAIAKLPELAALLTNAVPVGELQLHAPVRPGQVFCSIGNYRSQLAQAMSDAAAAKARDGFDLPSETALRARAASAIEDRHKGSPYVCAKSPAAICGPDAILHLPPDCSSADWEVELAVIIGKPAYQIASEEVMEYVAGYTVANDITRRDRIFRADPPGFGTDWLQCKNAPGFLPLGPYLIPRDCVADPTELRLKLMLNGETLQDEFATDMLFDIAAQVSYISQHVQLNIGDVICTGSPAGFGSHYQRYLREGDRLEAQIDGFGSQHIVIC